MAGRIRTSGSKSVTSSSLPSGDHVGQKASQGRDNPPPITNAAAISPFERPRALVHVPRVS